MRNTLPLYHFISACIDTSLLKLEGCWHHDLTISEFGKSTTLMRQRSWKYVVRIPTMSILVWNLTLYELENELVVVTHCRTLNSAADICCSSARKWKSKQGPGRRHAPGKYFQTEKGKSIVITFLLVYTSHL